MKNNDVAKLAALPTVKIWGSDLSQVKTVQYYKGKFVLHHEGHILLKLIPKLEWDLKVFYHDQMLAEQGIEAPTSDEVKSVLHGGGKAELVFSDDELHLKLYGISTNYGPYDADFIPVDFLKNILKEQGMNMPVTLTLE